MLWVFKRTVSPPQRDGFLITKQKLKLMEKKKIIYFAQILCWSGLMIVDFKAQNKLVYVLCA